MKRRRDFLIVNKFDSEEFNEFGRFLITNHDTDGFRYYADHTFYWCARCPIGKEQIDRREDLRRNVWELIFDKNVCKQCIRYKTCFNGQPECTKELYFVSAVGVNTFLRRIKAVKGKKVMEYDVKVNDTPCYAGWDFARILTNGDVIPCCKGYRKPLGNIYHDSFHSIWLSQKYNEFRKKAKSTSKGDAYFQEIECLKGCDNYGRNVDIDREIRILKIKGVLE